MAFESTNAILGVVDAERAKKNDRWKKLMDIASLGTDIWGTLSGRKYQTGEREAAQQFEAGKYGEGGFMRDYEKFKLDADLQSNKDWLDYQNAHPGKPADQLYAEWVMNTPEGQAFTKQQYEREANLRSISAGGSAASRANDLFEVIDNIKSQAQGTHWNVVTDEAGNTIIKFSRSPEETMKYFDTLIAAAKLSPEDAKYVREALSAWMSNPTAPGAVPTPGKNQPVDMNAAIQDLLNRLTPQIQSYLDSLKPEEQDRISQESSGAVADLMKPEGKNWIITPEAAKTIPRKSQYGVEKQEKDLAAELSGYLPVSQDAQERQNIQDAIALLNRPDILEWAPWKAIYALKEKLKQTYNAAKPKGR